MKILARIYQERDSVDLYKIDEKGSQSGYMGGVDGLINLEVWNKEWELSFENKSLLWVDLIQKGD